MHEGMNVSLFAGGTAENLNAITAKTNVTASANPTFIFGDYLAGLQAIGGILFDTITGGVVGDTMLALQQASLINSPGVIIFRLLYTFSSAMLILNILTGRDI